MQLDIASPEKVVKGLIDYEIGAFFKVFNTAMNDPRWVRENRSTAKVSFTAPDGSRRESHYSWPITIHERFSPAAIAEIEVKLKETGWVKVSSAGAYSKTEFIIATQNI